MRQYLSLYEQNLYAKGAKDLYATPWKTVVLRTYMLPSEQI